MASITKRLSLQIVKGLVGDFALPVAANKGVTVMELAQVLRELAEELLEKAPH